MIPGVLFFIIYTTNLYMKLEDYGKHGLVRCCYYTIAVPAVGIQYEMRVGSHRLRNAEIGHVLQFLHGSLHANTTLRTLVQLLLCGQS